MAAALSTAVIANCQVPIVLCFPSCQSSFPCQLRHAAAAAHTVRRLISAAIVFVSAVFNSRDITTSGVLQMQEALKKHDWSPSLVVGAKVVSRAWLKKNLGESDDSINKRIELLKQDVASKRLKDLGPHPHSLAQQLLDPSADKFVVIFDGQHRSVADGMALVCDGFARLAQLLLVVLCRASCV